MKLHLPLLLRKNLLSLLSYAGVLMGTPAEAGIMHTDVSYQTYMDFAQNCGRYVVGSRVNGLLQHIRTNVDKGIMIRYTDGTEPYVISNEQGMINFEATGDNGAYAAIAPNIIATVAHNGSNSASFGERIIGNNQAINYATIDIRNSDVFRLQMANYSDSNHDYMLQRQSKVATDISWSTPTSISDVQSMAGEYMFHSGAGSMGVYDEEKDQYISFPVCYAYVCGGIVSITGVAYSDNGNISASRNMMYGDGKGASMENPLPYANRSGDSGSPLYVYNSKSGQYEYFVAHSTGNGYSAGTGVGNIQWTLDTMGSFTESVDMSTSTTVYLGAIDKAIEIKEDNSGNKDEVYAGIVTDADGRQVAQYNGVQTRHNTWADLSDLKDTQNWYAYGADTDGKLLRSDTELFFCENLVFTGDGNTGNIVLNATVDLGIGYAEFNKGTYTISSQAGNNYQFNHAGYVINGDAEVHLQLTGDAGYMYEWRKVGDGNLHIEGEGVNNVLLNLGGNGKTYLNRTQKGNEAYYAAYNVLLNNGATVVISDTNQIKRDLTFGLGGGTLDMNGNSMEWHQTSDAEGRFTINALTEQAVIANGGEKSAALTFRESRDQVYAGSFQDSVTGGLKIDYQGGGTWLLNSIHTDLSHHEDSGLTVSSGQVTLAGINTVHGMGSLNAQNTERLVKLNDWHYADAAMNVTVKSGATFELGSHARLTGDVSVESGATYIMREGVHEQYEYVEGGAFLEDTYQYAAFYGQKGHVNLAENASFQIAYSEGTTTAATFAGNIRGAGDVSVNLSTSAARLTLEGDNSFSGRKTLSSGSLVGEKSTSLGDTTTHKWVLGERAWIASHADTAQELLDRVDGSSSGTLALSADTEQKLDLSGHQNLYLGAEEGKTVNYGAVGTTEKLEAVQQDAEGNYVWKLGGGGGTLIVNYQLSGNHDLLLGAESTSAGYVYLGNAANDFTGNIIFNSQGIKLGFASGALGAATLNLIYGCGAVVLHGADISSLSTDSAGILLLDNQPGGVNISGHAQLALGSSVDMRYAGNITVGEGQAYRFSAMDGATFTVGSRLSAGHDVMVEGQGYSGGTVVLAHTADITGAVTVMGHQAGEGGGITLGLVADNALANASSVSVQNACVLDIADTSQTFSKIDLQAGSLLVGAEGSAAMIGSAEDSALHGSI